MPATAIDHVLRSTIAGYYRYATGARYISPLVSGAAFPDLVDMHESQHRLFAHSNIVDCVGRFFAEAYKFGSGELDPTHKKLIGMLFETIHRNSMRTHEFVATYTSFLDFARWSLEDISRARAELPEFYASILRRAESAFGSIEDGRVRGHELRMIYSVIDCAAAAMSPSIPTGLIAFESITELMNYIERNSPDARFDTIIGRVRPFWDPTGLLWGVAFRTGDEDTLRWENAVHMRIRAELPDIDFVTYSGFEPFGPAVLSALKADARRQGYGFLENKGPVPPAPKDAIHWMGSQFEHPALRPESPIDLSLVQTRYADGSISDLTTAALAFHPDEGCIIAHIVPLEPDTPSDTNCDARVYCFAVGKFRRSWPRPFVFNAKFAEVAGAISKIPRTSIVLKLDERAGRPIALFLAGTGHSVFILLHNTLPSHLKQIVSAMAESQRVSVDIYELKSDRFAILMAALEQDRCVLLCPLTRLGLSVLSTELETLTNVYVPPDEKAGLERLRININQLRALMDTTYVGVPAKSRPKTN